MKTTMKPMAKKPTIKPTIKHARKVIDVVSCGLSDGLGEPKPGQMCIEAAVCYAFGLPHSDNPPCVGKEVRDVKIRLNDSSWSSNKARAKGMIRIAVAQLGSNTIDQEEFTRTLAALTVRTIAPIALRMVAKDCKSAKAKKLKEAASRCEIEGSRESAIDALKEIYTNREEYYVIDDATWAFSNPSRAIRAAAAITRAQKSPAARNRTLSLMADLIEEALTICKSPGCKWLYLLDKPIP